MRLDFLRPLYERTGPWVSVYLDASRQTEDGAEVAALRWRGLHADLDKQGAPAEALAALDDVVSEAAVPLALFAAGDRVALAAPLPRPPLRDIGMLSPLPHALPLLAALGEPVPWVRVVVDRTGADLLSSPGWRPPHAGEVRGDEDYPLRKVAAGGWSQARYQRAAEESWDRNAADVAEAVAREAEQVDAEVLVVAGDVRARQLLVDHLPPRWAPVAVQTEGSRAPGADPEALDGATEEVVRTAAARRRVAALDALHAGGEAVGATGLPGVVDALRQGRVATMLLTADGLGARLWLGPDGPALSADGGREVPAEDGLLCAAASTDAELVLAEPDELPDGVAAVLRW